MLANLEILATRFGISPEAIVLGLMAIGIMVFFLGVGSVVTGQHEDNQRTRRAMRGRQATDILSRGDSNPAGILKAFVPTSETERDAVRRKLRKAGIMTAGAVRNYFIVRSLLGFIMPAAFLAVLFVPSSIVSRFGLASPLDALDMKQAIFVLVMLLAAGFYGPALWLNDRIKARRLQIEHGLPAALDLLQVSVEAGMGFDAAMNRVAHELAEVCPPIAQEFMTVQLEIQAGMERETAFMKLSERCGVDELTSFTNVILQSAEFGTSVSSALQTYADEMRSTRELKAQEQANKLPVKMSGVMAAMMMPVLLMLTLTPVAIRWMRAFADI